jgi:hypothetical protein
MAYHCALPRVLGVRLTPSCSISSATDYSFRSTPRCRDREVNHGTGAYDLDNLGNE